jgi:hypothetical protein
LRKYKNSNLIHRFGEQNKLDNFFYTLQQFYSPISSNTHTNTDHMFDYVHLNVLRVH